MKTFMVTITEQYQTEVEVEASTYYDAVKLVQEKWEDTDFIMDSTNGIHFKGVSFTAEPTAEPAPEPIPKGRLSEL